jgi:hypothetical protein
VAHCLAVLGRHDAFCSKQLAVTEIKQPVMAGFPSIGLQLDGLGFNNNYYCQSASDHVFLGVDRGLSDSAFPSWNSRQALRQFSRTSSACSSRANGPTMTGDCTNCTDRVLIRNPSLQNRSGDGVNPHSGH